MTGQWRANVGDGGQTIGAVFLTTHQLLPPGKTAVAVAETSGLQGPARMQLPTRADITHLCGCRPVEGPPHHRSQFSHAVFLLQLGFCACKVEVALQEFNLRSVEWHQ